MQRTQDRHSMSIRSVPDLQPAGAARPHGVGGWDPYEVWRTRVLLPRQAAQRVRHAHEARHESSEEARPRSPRRRRLPVVLGHVAALAAGLAWTLLEGVVRR